MSNECTLTDQELINKIDSINGALCKSGGKSWCLSVPPDVNNDPDLLIAEMVKRFERMVKKERVRVYVSSEEHHAKLFVCGEKPNSMVGMYFAKSGDEQHCTMISRHAAKLLGVKKGECKAFEIRECL